MHWFTLLCSALHCSSGDRDSGAITSDHRHHYKPCNQCLQIQIQIQIQVQHTVQVNVKTVVQLGAPAPLQTAPNYIDWPSAALHIIWHPRQSRWSNAANSNPCSLYRCLWIKYKPGDVKWCCCVALRLERQLSLGERGQLILLQPHKKITDKKDLVELLYAVGCN